MGVPGFFAWLLKQDKRNRILINNCKFKLILGNLTLNKKKNYKNFYLSNDFLATSLYKKTKILNLITEKINLYS